MAGSEWTEEENRVVVREYLAMLSAEIADRQYVKAEHNRTVQGATGRSKGSVEFKFCNVSAVFQDLEKPWIDGYKPRENYQQSLRDVVEEELDQLGGLANAATIGSVESSSTGVHDLIDMSPLARVPERAFGGSDVAVAPDVVDDGFWPHGQPAPGADEAITWLRHRCSGDGPSAAVFLVGGPGNGKSFMSREAARGLQILDEGESRGLAARSYRYRTASGRDLLIINDATLADSASERAPLARDIERTLEAGDHLLVNVNRGILFEESVGGEGGLAFHLVEWLRDHPDQGTSDLELITSTPYLSVLHAHFGDRLVDIVVVWMDVCSLLERRPGVISGASAWRADSYQVERLDSRGGLQASDTPAGRVLADFIGSLPGPQDGSSPLLANVASLSSESVRRGVLTILRASEIVSGKRFTYRELWGAYARLVVGDTPALSETNEVWRALRPGGDLSDLVADACHRFHMALYGATTSPLEDVPPPRRDPVTKLTAPIDPVRDARPGHGGVGDGWATPVLDAFGGNDPGQSPMDVLRDSLSDDDPFSRAITDFDIRLDQALVAARRGGQLDDKRKRVLRAWYAEYLMRLYATAHGIPAFGEEINLFTMTHRASGPDGGQPPARLGEGLRTLLLPPFNPDAPGQGMLLPVFEARTEPVTTSGQQRRLVARFEPALQGITCVTRGDGVEARLTQAGEVKVRLELDFAILREALACAEGRIGVTEFTDTASPRLERFRSALLTSTQGIMPNYAVTREGTTVPLEVVT